MSAGRSFAQSDRAQKCYGDSYTLPFRYSPLLFKDKLYFTPSTGGSRRLVLDKGKSVDPRFKISYDSVEFTDLRYSDAGTFSTVNSYVNYHRDVISLKITDCSTKTVKYYGDSYSFDVPRQAEYLEYAPLQSPEQTTVLWNRTDSSVSDGGRGKLRYSSWRFTQLTPGDNGYYNLRAKDNRLVSRFRFTVEEKEVYYDVMVNDKLLINNPSTDSSWSVDFTPKGDSEPIALVREGRLILSQWDTMAFGDRASVLIEGIEIAPVELTEAGTYVFRDSKGYQAQTAFVSVNYEPTPTFVYVAIIAGVILGVLVIYCCMRKCCCKKSSKRSAAAPATYYRDQSQPEHPSNSAAPAAPSYSAAPAAPSYSPAAPSYSPAPAARSYSPARVGPSHSAAPAESFSYSPLNPTDPNTSVACPAGQRAMISAGLGSDFLSSNPQPTFDPKGLAFSSAPLSSEINFSHVYNSAKLNFISEVH
ncbi:uncharacterized protein [Antennarius striatus]|uniref:uncharacterized protein isoform X2 n=1 Tax=Antennarius striatus TaxID=241820 RepID=UPI0035AE6815